MGKLLQNLTTWKGNYREIKFLIEDVATVEDCLEAEWAMSASESSAALITKSTDDDPATITFSGKYVIVKLFPEDTDEDSEIEPGNYYHELRLIDPSGNPSTPAIGIVTLKAVVLTGA